MQRLNDVGLVFGYELRRTLRNPVWMIFGLFQPILYLVMFAPLLDGLGRSPATGGGRTLEFFTPGVLIILALFGAVSVGYGLIAELRAGVLERVAVTPASRAALVLGRVLRDLVVLLVQALLVLGIAWLMGMRAPAGGLAVSLLLLMVLGTAASTWSYAVALATRDENGLSATQNFLLFPLLLLSGVLLPLSLAPAWMRAIATVNPFAHAVDASRALFAGQLGAGSVPLAFATGGALAVLMLTWAVNSFRRVT